ncbi:hypothetical protein NOR51B_1432 [Luminiphilus syltensis NOR5-1B]|uniref:DUF2066 domain-containing protein n=1 Tax=Luminiphilus syltensis NOR5-1B TaxID=565045 RepID=B8KQC9_9GAMM|nr:DUF2066 domain-containing protein [Luminiphilus syltensis]EED35486.1 hypothetical protein NOR51B_1432 [Luminiphilus syltensis NOR5-1B]
MKLFAAVALLLTLVALPARADDPFYAASVDTADRGEQAFRTSARQALARVLVRVSGSEAVLEMPEAAAALAKAAGNVSLYRYTTVGDQRVLFVQFDPDLIKGILRRSGAMYWPEQRPPVLAWLVLDGPSGRRFADPATDIELIEGLREGFSNRGVDLRLPLHDLEDQATITTETVWQKALPQLQLGSRRYGTDHVLVGRLVELSSGAILCDWLYFDSESRMTRQSRSEDLMAAVAPAVDLAVDSMAQQYGVALIDLAGTSHLIVRVEGVDNYDQYQSVSELLSSIDVIEFLQTVAIEADAVVFRLSGIDDNETLLRLLPQGSAVSVLDSSAEQQVSLRWMAP